jgi:hypothetical protein
MQALSFTDEQLSALMRAATPLPPGDRTSFPRQLPPSSTAKSWATGLSFGRSARPRATTSIRRNGSPQARAAERAPGVEGGLGAGA